MIYFQSLTLDELAELLLPLSRPKSRSAYEALTPEKRELYLRKQAMLRAKLIYHWVYQRFVTDWEQMTDLSKDVRTWLSANLTIYRLKEQFSKQAEDGTHKFLWKLDDGKTIESVIIPAALQPKEDGDGNDDDEGDLEGHSPREGAIANVGDRRSVNPTALTASNYAGKQVDDSALDLSGSRWRRLTVCISSQVGCAMACKFCLTGVQGLDRHLGAHEIVTQVWELRRQAPITNIVFMGMGEPLHNLENVIKACQILIAADGMHFSKRKVTVSTSGLVPAIEELGRRVDVSLAISLNGSNDEQRSAIMPVNKRWNLASLLGTLRNYPLGAHRRITFEYVLLKDFNDSIEDAQRVERLLRGIPAKVNLIPFNEHPGSEFKRPSDETVRAFQKYLLSRDLTTTVRISRGRDILAACGQLRSIFGTARGTAKHKDSEYLGGLLRAEDAKSSEPAGPPAAG